ncbi:MAG: hypothetical protein KC416_08820 [Myxococcales bacterium]|nr:hypothetical protein [Myxococcales bacterium]
MLYFDVVAMLTGLVAIAAGGLVLGGTGRRRGLAFGIALGLWGAVDFLLRIGTPWDGAHTAAGAGVIGIAVLIGVTRKGLRGAKAPSQQDPTQ